MLSPEGGVGKILLPIPPTSEELDSSKILEPSKHLPAEDKAKGQRDTLNSQTVMLSPEGGIGKILLPIPPTSEELDSSKILEPSKHLPAEDKPTSPSDTLNSQTVMLSPEGGVGKILLPIPPTSEELDSSKILQPSKHLPAEDKTKGQRGTLNSQTVMLSSEGGVGKILLPIPPTSEELDPDGFEPQPNNLIPKNEEDDHNSNNKQDHAHHRNIQLRLSEYSSEDACKGIKDMCFVLTIIAIVATVFLIPFFIFLGVSYSGKKLQTPLRIAAGIYLGFYFICGCCCCCCYIIFVKIKGKT